MWRTEPRPSLLRTVKLWRDRVLADGKDREVWLDARLPVIGASDAAHFVKSDRVESYVVAKLTAGDFAGNAYTRRGHEFEPDILSFLGVEPSAALIHAPGNRGFAATPDGISGAVGAECKVRHGVIDTEPAAAEWRQLAWQFFCVPELEVIQFGTLILVQDDGDWVPRDRDAFHRLEVPADHPRIVRAIAQILPIAEKVLTALTWAREAQKGIEF